MTDAELKINLPYEFRDYIDEDPESYVYTSAFSSTEDFAAHLRSLYAASEIDCGVSVTPDDRIVTLSTCTYSGRDVRFVVCGKLTEIA